MSATPENQWLRFQQRYMWFDSIGLGLDFSRTNMPIGYVDKMRKPIDRAFAEMRALESGAIANPDENRMVGHYWLRNPALAPTLEIRRDIEGTIEAVKFFAQDIHSGKTQGRGGPFTHLLLIGIGGSALGPQFVSHALGHPKTDKMRIHFIDNTDPDGFERVLAELEGALDRTLCVVVSKSGGTKETRNGMMEVEAVYQRCGLPFGKYAVAVTANGSELAERAERNNWLRIFPMWDWVGGRTSELSAVGLLPASLQGFDIDSMLSGAKEADNVTRGEYQSQNPSMQLAIFWYVIGNGHGEKAMIVLPYKDRLELFSRYLQQLVMESLGKQFNRHGQEVNQGLTVFGNKGSTDQHAYIQQLREGLENFFCIFVAVMRDQRDESIAVDNLTTSGDYLDGFLLGTREALFERKRESVLLTLKQVDAFHIGVLIALFERTVGYYASLIDINAYHQPGVEAGKKAATTIIQLQHAVIKYLSSQPETFFMIPEIALRAGAVERADTVFRICVHLCVNDRLRGRDIHTPNKASFAAL